MQQTVFEDIFELKKEAVASHPYYPRIYEVKMPCQWLKNCYDGKCPAFTKINGNYYCARKDNR